MELSLQLILVCTLHCGGLLVALAASDRATDLRLPRSLLPVLYDIKVLPIIEVNNFTIPGSVEILMNCVQTTSQITLHSADITIDYPSIRVSNAATGQVTMVTGTSVDTQREFLILTLASPLQAGQQYKLFIKFTSYLNDQMRGFYRSSYTENGQMKYLAVTQMEATDARRAFPCFDEPNMKAKFAVTLGRKESMSSASNMPLISTIPVDGMPGYVWDVYQTSLTMSTYLVAMLVSEFTTLESPAVLSNIKFRVWTRPSATDQAVYASIIGPQVLKFYEEYFQIPIPMPKQDMAAIPDFAYASMENWGLITYRETDVLYDPVISSEVNKQRIACVVAHELSHQWFGNLVTMDWWTDLWLNEGFALHMEHIAADYVEPNMKIRQQIVTDHVQFVYAMDALETSHPISATVIDPAIDNNMDRITYSKGGALVRMLSGILGEATFKRALTAYLKSRMYANAVQDDLWAALTQQATLDRVALPADIKTIMDTWTLKMGFPVIKVTRNYTTRSAVVTQDRFLLRSTGSTNDSTVYQWWVPLTYTSDFTASPRIKWLSKDEKSKRMCLGTAPDRWVVFNVDELGYYRVNYDEQNWQLLQNQLQADHTKIGVINRAQIMDDSLNIARVNLLPYATALDLTRILSPNQKRVITCTAVANGGEPEWNFAFDRYKVSNVATDRDVLLNAMSCSRDPTLLARMLDQSTNLTSGIRPSEASKLFRYVAANPAGTSMAFDYIKNRWSAMVSYYATMYDITKLMDAVASGFNTQAEVDALKNFRDVHLSELGAATRSVQQSIEKAEANTKWMELHYNEILLWLQSH